MAYKPGFDNRETRSYYHSGSGSIRSDREIELRCVQKLSGSNLEKLRGCGVAGEALRKQDRMVESVLRRHRKRQALFLDWGLLNSAHYCVPRAHWHLLEICGQPHHS